MNSSHLQVSFAAERDLHWLCQHDSHLDQAHIAQKIERQEYILAKVDEQPVGYIRLSYFWSMIPFVDIIAVDDDQQRKGVGKALLGFVEPLARSKGQKILMSSSQSDELAPQAWHRHMGFVDAGAIIDLKPLQNVSEIIFVKRLE
jgi:GNAT superfamily N-acetyltransferase